MYNNVLLKYKTRVATRSKLLLRYNYNKQFNTYRRSNMYVTLKYSLLLKYARNTLYNNIYNKFKK